MDYNLNRLQMRQNRLKREFSLKYLILFTKCTNLCQQINLYIKDDYPLIIRYLVASLGHIKLCLAPNSS